MPRLKKPRKAGRPPLPKGDARDAMIRIRVTLNESKAIDAAAKAKKQTVSEWIRSALNAAV
jgi:uncharacterized protein (DUF1778 family)